MSADYRFAPRVTARLLGVSLVVAAVLILLSTLVVAAADWHTAVLLVPVALVLVGLAAVMAWAQGFVVRLTEDGYQVRRIRGAGTTGARWVEVEDAVTTYRHEAPCLVLRLRDGRSTTIPVEVLNIDKDQFARTIQQHLDRGHGLRRL